MGTKLYLRPDHELPKGSPTTNCINTAKFSQRKISIDGEKLVNSVYDKTQREFERFKEGKVTLKYTEARVKKPSFRVQIANSKVFPKLVHIEDPRNLSYPILLNGNRPERPYRGFRPQTPRQSARTYDDHLNHL